MKVKLREREGKYYGSFIDIETPFDGYGDFTLKVWHPGNFIPSKRELEYYNMTCEEYIENDMMCDGHFESKFTYDFCKYLMKCIEKY